MQKYSNVTTAEARKTAFIVAGVLAAVAAWLGYRGRVTAAAIIGAVVLVLIIIGGLVPPAAKLFHRGWMTIAYALGYVNSRIILSLVYFLVFVPYGIISKVLGRDALDRHGAKRASYWHKRTKTRPEPEQFERMF